MKPIVTLCLREKITQGEVYSENNCLSAINRYVYEFINSLAEA